MSAKPEYLSEPPALPRSRSIDTGGAVLRDVLRWLRIGGAIFLRAEFTAPWAYESPTGAELARALKPGARNG
jgi:hypothetical protein